MIMQCISLHLGSYKNNVNPGFSHFSHTILTLTMSATANDIATAALQNPNLSPLDRLFTLLRGLTRKLDSLHRLFDPALRPQIENSVSPPEYNEANCAELRRFLADAENELGIAVLVRAAGVLMVAELPHREGLRLETLLVRMAGSEGELRGTVDWVRGVLARWEGTEGGLVVG